MCYLTFYAQEQQTTVTCMNISVKGETQLHEEQEQST